MQGKESNIYHICTSGLFKDLWFHDEEDYRLGMNSIPVCAILYDVTIYCFCLMSNHVHFILKGEKDNCSKFIREYKRVRSRHLVSKYSGIHSLNGADLCIKQIDSPEYFKTVVAYVMRNPTSAKLPLMPSEYRWSSSYLYFADYSLKKAKLRKLSDLTVKEKREIIKTRIAIPDYFTIEDDGVIFPGNYIDFKAVEGIFKTPKQLLYYLSSTKDMEEELESGLLSKAYYNDQELKASLDNICSEKYPNKTFNMLNIERRFVIARELRKRYGAAPKQIARVTSLDYSILKSLL